MAGWRGGDAGTESQCISCPPNLEANDAEALRHRCRSGCTPQPLLAIKSPPDYVQSSANGFFQCVIPAFAGMTGFRRACARVSIDPERKLSFVRNQESPWSRCLITPNPETMKQRRRTRRRPLAWHTVSGGVEHFRDAHRKAVQTDRFRPPAPTEHTMLGIRIAVENKYRHGLVAGSTIQYSGMWACA